MKIKDIIALQNGMNACGNLVGSKFVYCLAKNNMLIKPEIEAVQKAAEASEDFQEYDAKRIDIAKAHAKKDKDGKEMEANGQFVFEDRDAFAKAVKKLQGEYADAIKKRDKQVAEVNKLLEEETKVEIFKIDMEDVPENITVAQSVGIALLYK